MAAAIALRDDFDGLALRRMSKQTKDAAQARRLLALAAIYDGGSRTDAARIADVGLQTLRDWVLRFNARGPAGLINGKAPGNASKLDDAQRQALAAIVERGPIPAIHEVVRWRLADLAQWIEEDHPWRVDPTPTTIVTGKRPKVSRLGSTAPGIENRCRRLVHEQFRRCLQVLGQPVHYGPKVERGHAHPVGQGAAVDVDARSGKDLALAI